MTFFYQVEIDEKETNLTEREIADKGLEALSNAFSELDCYFDCGYNPQLFIKAKC